MKYFRVVIFFLLLGCGRRGDHGFGAAESRLDSLRKLVDGISTPIDESKLKFSMSGGPGEYLIELDTGAHEKAGILDECMYAKILGSKTDPDAVYFTFKNGDNWVVMFASKVGPPVVKGYKTSYLGHRVYRLGR